MFTKVSGVGRVPGWLGASVGMMLGLSARIGLVIAVYEMPGVKGNRRGLHGNRWEFGG
jgi:hypothetical protein